MRVNSGCLSFRLIQYGFYSLFDFLGSLIQQDWKILSNKNLVLTHETSVYQSVSFAVIGNGFYKYRLLRDCHGDLSAKISENIR